MSSKTELSILFESLYNEHFDKLFRYSYSIVRDKNMAEDVVADVFENIWCNKEELTKINNIRAYLLRSVKNLSVHKLEKKRDVISADFHTQDILLSNTDPELILEGHELEKVIETLSKDLSPHGKLVFDMSRNKGLNKDEIAKELGITRRAVNKHLQKVQNHFRKSLDNYFQKEDAYFYISKISSFLMPISSIPLLIL